MKRRTLAGCAAYLSLVTIVLSATPSLLLAQNLQVTSATPPAAPQGTTNLNVVVGGNGFAKGAKAAFYLSGTNNPAGVTVNSTAFNSKSQVTANINVADTATISNFDVMVTNTDGRSGKGTQLFSVTAKGTPVGCTTLGTPSGFTLASTLNYVNSSGAPQYQPHLGTVMSVRPVTLTNGSDYHTVQIAAVGSGNNSGRMEFFFLDPTTGQVLDGTAIVGTQVQPHITVQFDSTATIGARVIGAGDVNADGIPDFVVGSIDNNTAIAFLGSMDANGILSYKFVYLSPPASNLGNFGKSVATGTLDGSSAGDEIIVSGTISTGVKKGTEGAVYIFRFNGSGFDLIQTVVSPLVNNDGGFGKSLAVGDVTGDGVPDLMVGAPSTTVGAASDAGAVFVFPSPLTSTTYFMLTTGISSDFIGTKVGSGMLSSATATDVIATSTSSSNPRDVLFSGPITGNRTASSFDFLPDKGLTGGWATSFDTGDITGDGHVEVLVGAPNASNSNSCNSSVGAAQLFLSNPSNPSQPTLTIFQPPTVDPSFGGFGFGVGLVPYSLGNPPLLMVGENGRDMGGVTGAGQVYVYRKN
ncbi:MAG TPA: FG-GAP repeat protein [Terriglobia bacterium]|nr:FG-GAP repeat protein [Terriglobia bacterium]